MNEPADRKELQNDGDPIRDAALPKDVIEPLGRDVSGYREGMLRAAEIAESYAAKFDDTKPKWVAGKTIATLIRTDGAEADALAPQPAYTPVVIDFPEGGYTELALVDDFIVWDAPVAASLDIGWDAERTKRIAVRWSLAPKPAAAPEVDQLAEDMAAAFAQAIGDPAGWQSCIITLKRVLAAPPAPVLAGEVTEVVFKLRSEFSAKEAAADPEKDVKEFSRWWGAVDACNRILAALTAAQPRADAGEVTEALARLRSEGWTVAVHNDYRQSGVFHTFWLFTNAEGRWIKGEGQTDTEALRAALAARGGQS